jgi:hypothetical protein
MPEIQLERNCRDDKNKLRTLFDNLIAFASGEFSMESPGVLSGFSRSEANMRRNRKGQKIS